MLNVVCVRVGQKYSPEYVFKLKSMVSRHLQQEHKFICMTENPWQVKGVDTIPAPIPVPDSWCKIGLFAPTLQIPKGEKILYLDLDVIITGSLDALIKGKLENAQPLTITDKETGANINDGIPQNSKDFWIAQDWRDPFNSSVMYWVHGEQTRIYSKFSASDMQRLSGDQNLIAELVPTAQVFDKKDILSYKFSIGVKDKDEKPKTKIVLFHGRPKMTDLPNVNWIKEEWK